MALVLKNRVKTTSVTAGIGTISLGSAVTGYQSFASIGDGNQTYYLIKGTLDWEVGKGTYTTSGNTLSRDIVFSSSNGGALVNFSTETKNVLCAYPSAAMPLGMATCDNSKISSDLSAWSAFQAALNNSIAGGVTFDNAGTNGIVSTYSLVYTTTNAYYGGVLAPNGDVHFVPNDANRGQKISAAGVVSTYSLVYTNGSFAGGTLSRNGIIDFIPVNSGTFPTGQIRGQRINSSGVVSTYSLAYTGTAGSYYWGGILAPNGEVHFAPYLSPVGQKISAAGVVSTYSLIYTQNISKYSGGVLAPNGDIHFVPYSARVGQKISATGVVSTYSLVTTTSVGYIGGVLSLNGDIHFIPSSAQVGQKIAIDGTVSTYSLVYTTSSAYRGGVLAPNGDIHFVPSNAPVGQKISTAGVVSTYSLAYTLSSGAYAGGVLMPNGDIHFVPHRAAVGQKISTNVGAPLGIGLCLSSFLNKL
jgi:hypothetical protein